MAKSIKKTKYSCHLGVMILEYLSCNSHGLTGYQTPNIDRPTSAHQRSSQIFIYIKNDKNLFRIDELEEW